MSDNSSATDIRGLLESAYVEEPTNESENKVQTEAVAEPVVETAEHSEEESKPVVEVRETTQDEVNTEDTDSNETVKKKSKEEHPPQSWKPALREKWSALPADVRAEIDRREREMQHALQTSAQERKAASEFTEAVRPYEAIIRAEGGTPVTAIKSLLNSAYVLRNAPADHKAHLVAQLITQYGVNPALIGQHLAGAAPAVDPNTYALQQKIAQLEAQVSQVVQAPVVQQQQAIEKQISDFTSDPKNEFVGDVMNHMIALINGGAASNLQDAYDQACYANPEIRKILHDRSVQVSSKRTASASVAGSPRSSAAASNVGKSLSIADALRAAMGDPRSRI